MSLKIELKDEQSWYSSYDTLQGKLDLDLKLSVEIARVTVSLIGLCRVNLTRVDDVGQKFLDHVEDEVYFLNLKSQVFPPAGQDMCSKYSLRTGSHSWPFQFEFPWLVPGSDYKLPPSISDLDPEVASIQYYLKAEVERPPGIKHPILYSIRKPIIFLSNDDQKELDSVSTYGVFQAQSSRVQSSSRSVGGLISRLVSTLVHDRSAICSNVATFEIKSDLLLTPNLKTSIGIAAKALKPDERVTVSALRIELVSRTYLRAKNLEKIEDNCIVLFDKQNVKLGTGDLLAQSDFRSLIVPDSVPPSFEFPNMKRAYRLDVKIKWSHEPSSALVHKAQAGRLVWVRSGIFASPSYDTGEIIRPNRGFPQAKWYAKC